MPASSSSSSSSSSLQSTSHLSYPRDDYNTFSPYTPSKGVNKVTVPQVCLTFRWILLHENFSGGCHFGDGKFKLRREHNRRRFVVLSMVLFYPWWYRQPYKLLCSKPSTYKKWLEIYSFVFINWYRLSTQICSHVCTVTDCLVVQFSILSFSFSITPDMDLIMPNVLTVSQHS